jgi:hypothetical protein
LGATPDHRGRSLVTGDVFIGVLPVLGAPDAAVGRVDREQVDTGASGHGGQTVAEHRGGDTPAYHGAAEPFPALPAPHGLAAGGAGVGEVEVFDCDRGDPAPVGVPQELGDRAPYLGVAA